MMGTVKRPALNFEEQIFTQEGGLKVIRGHRGKIMLTTDLGYLSVRKNEIIRGIQAWTNLKIRASRTAGILFIRIEFPNIF